jgi:hypothetical protein
MIENNPYKNSESIINKSINEQISYIYLRLSEIIEKAFIQYGEKHFTEYYKNCERLSDLSTKLSRTFQYEEGMPESQKELCDIWEKQFIYLLIQLNKFVVDPTEERKDMLKNYFKMMQKTWSELRTTNVQDKTTTEKPESLTPSQQSFSTSI